MYKINKEENNISKIDERKFSELGFKEREHLQEWIAKNPSCLGEDLLVIQKEFSGFNDTSERLDLLAMDKTGDLVIIENKLDDSGRDVVWQAQKYASYCSSLTKTQIIKIYQNFLQKERREEKAADNLLDFFGIEDLDAKEFNTPQSQKIFFVASSFRKEVTSTVL
jgi:RecB family endonuclease NucS